MEYLNSAWLLWDALNNNRDNIRLTADSFSLSPIPEVIIVITDLYRAIITPYHAIYYSGDTVYVIGANEDVTTIAGINNHLLSLTGGIIIPSNKWFYTLVSPYYSLPPVPVVFNDNSIICDVNDDIRQRIYFDHQGKLFLELEVDINFDQYVFKISPSWDESGQLNYSISLKSENADNLFDESIFYYQNGQLYQIMFYVEHPSERYFDQYIVNLNDKGTHFVYWNNEGSTTYLYTNIINQIQTIEGINELVYEVLQS